MAESPYTTALALKRPSPTWVVPGADNDRLTAYATYEDMWNNVPSAYAELLRTGDDEKARRYVPAIRGLIESTNRYLAQGLDTTWEPLPGATVPDDAMKEFLNRLDALFRREEFGIKFLALKRWMLIRGDGLLMLSADPSKPEGERIRVTEVSAGQYFPIWDANDAERVTGCYIASIVLDDAGDEIVQRIEYRRVLSQADIDLLGGQTGNVWYRLGFYDKGHWDDRAADADPVQQVDNPSWAPAADPAADVYSGVLLPAEITAIPVYHFRNQRRGGIDGRFGISEVQGLETLFAGVVQNATDEDMSVAMNGLGAYWTDSGKPRDERGNELDWEIGPASMIELEKDGKIGRLSGISSVQPYQDHMSFLTGAGREASAVPDIAVGRVGAQVVQSGVALAIEFMPIIAKNVEKQAELTSKLNHLLYDLVNGWMPAYEGWPAPQLVGTVTFDDPMPVDRAAVLKEILDMVTAKVVSIQWAQGAIAERLGYQFPTDMLQQMITEQEQMLDAIGARAAIDGTANTQP